MHFFYTSLTNITTTLEFALSWYNAVKPTFELDNYRIEISFYQQKNQDNTDRAPDGLYCNVIVL